MSVCMEERQPWHQPAGWRKISQGSLLSVHLRQVQMRHEKKLMHT